MKRKAIITGATGLIGSELLQILLNDSDYERILSAGRKKTGIIHPKLVEHAMELSDLDGFQPDFRPDDVFCTLGTTIKTAGSQEQFRKVDHDFVLAAARLAETSGAGQFLVVSALGADVDSGIFYNRVKGEMERDVGKLKIPCVHFFRPSLLLGRRREFRLGEKIAQLVLPFLSFLFLGPLKKFKPVRASSVARFMIACAKKNEAGIRIHENNTFVN